MRGSRLLPGLALLAATLVAPAGAAAAQGGAPQTLPFDTAHSRVGFHLRTRWGQRLQGEFPAYAGEVRIGADGRLVSYEQVLTSEKFATIKIDSANKEEVLRTVGRPAETSRVALRNYEVWSYRYKEAGVWNSLMHVHFDQQGVVRQMMNGPDPMYEPKEKMGW